MQMAIRLLKNRPFRFLLQCISLSSPEGVTAVFGAGILAAFFLNPQHINLPNLCIVKEFLGCCPACGTTRALACFFKGEFAESIKYNLNVILAAPLIIGVFLKNLFKVAMNHRKPFIKSGKDIESETNKKQLIIIAGWKIV